MSIIVIQREDWQWGTRYSVEPDLPELRCALAAISHWRSLADVVAFARQRHGYGNSDGGFGVTYPGDLDEYDRVVLGEFILEGYVEVYSFWGPPHGYEYQIPEQVYLELLRQVLLLEGQTALAKQVALLADAQPRDDA